MLEDTKEYISYAPKNEIKAQNRHPFDLLVSFFLFVLYGTNQYSYSNHIGLCFKCLWQVIINPKLEKKGNKTALFFEGCLR